MAAIEDDDRDGLLAKAAIAEQAERYEDMKEFMKKVICFGAENGGDSKPKNLSTEERNLFSVAYKNVVGTRRSAWRVVSSIEYKARESSNKIRETHCSQYRRRIETELQGICLEVLSLLNNLINEDNSCEESVFYFKMKGDYYRYLSEVVMENRDSFEGFLKQASDAYTEAMKICEVNNLGPTNPITLGLALNFSVFYYEIANKPDKACELAKKAFEEAVSKLDPSQEGTPSYKDSTLILQLLRDNLTLWTSDLGEDTAQNE